MRNLLAAIILFVAVGVRADTNAARALILVVGAPGEPEYADQFSKWSASWKAAAEKGALQTFVIGESKDSRQEDRQQLLTVISNEVARPDGELWIVFIGHGTYDGRTANFNLRGPDISAADLAAALHSCHRPLAIIDCASASGPFLTALSAPGRVIVVATRSGSEVNATRFGGYLADAIANPAADLDKDGQTSLLEAFLSAARQTEQFYKDQGRLMTEHALLDDNGDSLGTPATFFKGVRAIKNAAGGKSVDGVRAHQMFLVPGNAELALSPDARAHRDELEQKLSALRAQKAKLSDDDYYRQVEAIIVETARLSQTQPVK